MIHSSSSVRHVVEIIHCVVDATIGNSYIVTRTSVNHHDVVKMGFQLPLQVHNEAQGGRVCRAQEMFYTIHYVLLPIDCALGELIVLMRLNHVCVIFFSLFLISCVLTFTYFCCFADEVDVFSIRASQRLWSKRVPLHMACLCKVMVELYEEFL